jgi:hypothetical protein
MQTWRRWGAVAVVGLVACSGNGAGTGGAGGTGSGAAGPTGSTGATAANGTGTGTGTGNGTGTTGATTGNTGSTGTGMSNTCAVFLATSPWNTDISGVAVDPADQAYLTHMSPGTHLHPDFGSNFGIPYQYVNNGVSKSPVTFDPQAANESDAGPYPIPQNPLIEQGSDAHMLMIQTDECVLYELFSVAQQGSNWTAYSGAIWDLKTNSTRPTCWTSADAAGLPIFPGLARWEEASTGAIHHALRFTMNQVQKAFVAPAGHYAGGNTSATLPPFGLRLRLKASVDISAATPQAKIVLTALKQYGMFLADIGSDWYISGAPDAGWDDNDLDFIKGLTGSDFEVLPHGALTGPAGCP